MSVNSLSYAVIGGGITGLTAAYYLSRAGEKGVVIEPDEPGGVLQSVQRDGFTCDQGPNVFIEKPALSELLKDLEMLDERVYPAIVPYRQHVFYEGKAVSVPKSPADLIKSPFLSPGNAGRVLAALTGIKSCKVAAVDESIAVFLGRILGERPVYSLVEPALQGIYGGRVDNLSARSVFPSLWEHCLKSRSLLTYMRQKASRRIFVLRNGAASLAEKVVECLPEDTIVKGKVKGLQQNEEKIFELLLESGDVIRAKNVIVATSGKASAALIGNFNSELASKLSDIEYAPLVMTQVVLSNSYKLPEQSFGVLFPPGSGSGVLGIMCKSTLFPHVAPADKTLITVCLGGTGRADLIEFSDSELTAHLKSALSSLLGIESADIIGIKRWLRAIPQFAVGHWKIVAAMRDFEKNHPGIYLAGVDTGGVGVPDRVKMAKDCADLLLKRIGK